MDRVTFDKVVTDQLSRSELLLTSKGREYAEKAEADTAVDRLEHFKKAAVLQGETTEQETWDEKITDSINYLLILRAVVAEGRIA